MLGGLRRLVRIGLDPRAPARERKQVLLTNAITLIAVAQLVPLAALAALVNLDVTVMWIAGSAAGFLSVLGVAATGHVLAARAWLAVIASIAIVGAGVVLGSELRVEVYFLTAVSATWYSWSSGRHALLNTILFVIAYVVLLVLYERVDPIEPPPAELVRPFGVALFAQCMLALLGIVAWSHRETTLTDQKLDHEHARSERLLRNVLPDTIALRLKDGEATVADRFDEVTVMFADLVGFTTLSATLAPERVVELLNRVFTRFDELAARHRVEKIKTIGDAYMVVAGLPEPRTDHADAAARMALDLRQAMVELRATLGHPVQIRIGLCSGPAVAGVIGIQKFAYDLWGDTVNTAARMESHGAAGEIQVTESTYARLRDRFDFDDRGIIEVKGKGPMRTYFLRGIAARSP